MKQQEGMPSWVYWGLWGINSRGMALGFFWSCIAVGVLCIPLAFVLMDAVVGVGLFVAAAWYWFAIKWVDDNASWG